MYAIGHQSRETLHVNRLSDFDTGKKIPTGTLKNDQRVLTAKSSVNEFIFIAERKFTDNGNHVGLAISRAGLTKFRTPTRNKATYAK